MSLADYGAPIGSADPSGWPIRRVLGPTIRTNPFRLLALSKQSAVRALKSVTVTRPIWAVDAPADL